MLDLGGLHASAEESPSSRQGYLVNETHSYAIDRFRALTHAERPAVSCRWGAQPRRGR